jgi:hypothetical protein
VLDDAGMLAAFVAELGWELPVGTTSIGVDQNKVSAAIGAVEDVLAAELKGADELTLAGNYAALAAAIPPVVSDVYGAGTAAKAILDQTFVQATDFVTALPRRLLDYLLIEHCRERHARTYYALEAAGVFKLDHVDEDPQRFISDHTRREVDLDRLQKLITAPKGLFADVYGWGGANADLAALFDRLFYFFLTLGAEAGLVLPHPAKASNLSAPGDPAKAPEPHELRIPLVRLGEIGAETEAGLELISLPPASAGGPVGLSLGAYATDAVTEEVPLDAARHWILRFEASLDLTAGLALVFRPGQDPKLLTDLFGAGAQGSGAVSVRLRHRAGAGQRANLLTVARGSGITAQEPYVQVSLRDTVGQTPEVAVEFGAQNGRLSCPLHNADSFLAKLLPSSLEDVDLDVGIGWSSRRGVYFKGGAGLDVTIAAHLTLGPIVLEAVEISIQPQQDKIPIAIGVTAGFVLGPFAGAVDGVGVVLEATFPKDGGNLGPLHLQGKFKPPKGLGLAVDATAVKGGGFLYFDPDKGEYGGFLELSIQKVVQVKAIGILNTKLPDGKPGFSLLLILTAQFPPIQLSFGFTLTGIGGLIGVNRTSVVEVLRVGVKTHTLDSILFPKDPIANAPQIISDLKAVFPEAEGRYVFGPMVEVGWGTPKLVTAQLGVLIELPAPVRIVILGQITAVLPDKKVAAVVLHLDAVGVVEFEKQSFSIDASLYDSYVTKFPLSGDMAMRMNWGSNPNFALAVGGLNPRFQPPPGFPALRRLTLSMGSGNNPRLSLETYIALTSNSAQFGARLELWGEGGGFKVHGFLGFDTLLTFPPISLIADMSAAVEVLKGSAVLLSVNLDFTLTGPAPWHAVGTATFKVLFVTVKVGFDKTWGEAVQAELPIADVKAPLLTALADPGSWNAEPPPGGEQATSLQAKPALPTGTILVHPFGQLTVRQRVVPLGQTITKVGSAQPSGPTQFTITAAELNQEQVSREGVTDYFARGQFFDMTDDEKLTKESFESMTAGVALGSGKVKSGKRSKMQVQYDTYIVDDPIRPARRGARYKLPGHVYAAQIKQGAAELSPVLHTGEDKYVEPGASSPISIKNTEFVIASAHDLTVRSDLTPSGQGRAGTEQALAEHLQEHPEDEGSLQVMPAYEAAVGA